jgi:site-specific recombinase XerD
MVAHLGNVGIFPTEIGRVGQDGKSACSCSEMFPENWRIKLENEMHSRKFSPKTRSNYIYFNRLLCNTVQKSPDKICQQDITQFLAVLEKDKSYSAASLNIAISSIKFFHKWILKKDISPEHHRPRQDKRLPIVISKSEIAAMFKVVRNLKHRLLLMIVYSSGLRVGEVVCLKRHDLDKYRKSLTVISGKGRKDRQTIMSSAVLDILDDYYAQYDTSNWLFPGINSINHLSIRTAQHIFENAAKKANIGKTTSIHSLRHSFATHLLENGTDIRYIQELLGHNTIRTTERYTHVARHKIANIISPLDTIDDGD